MFVRFLVKYTYILYAFIVKSIACERNWDLCVFNDITCTM